MITVTVVVLNAMEQASNPGNNSVRIKAELCWNEGTLVEGARVSQVGIRERAASPANRDEAQAWQVAVVGVEKNCPSGDDARRVFREGIPPLHKKHFSTGAFLTKRTKDRGRCMYSRCVACAFRLRITQHAYRDTQLTNKAFRGGRHYFLPAHTPVYQRPFFFFVFSP